MIQIYRHLFRKIHTVVSRPSILLRRVKKEYCLRVGLPRLLDQTRQMVLATSALDLNPLIERILCYVKSNHRPEIGFGNYSYVSGGPPLLYASCYAALTRHLCNDLNALTVSERREWIAYIQQHQSDDGLFRDKLIDCPLAESADWWGWRHLTLHALMALTALGGTARKPFQMLNSFRKPGVMAEWLESRNWQQDAASVSNEIQNYGTALQYARDFQDELWCANALNEMYQWLNLRQDSVTGYWGYGNQTKSDLSLGVQTGYHLWLLYFYDGKPIQYIDRIIDSCLETQNRYGGFGVALNSSACEDIDSVDPLVRLSSLTDYRQGDVRKALERAVVWIHANFNPDGGAVFRRGEPFAYGHELMFADCNRSSMFPTWFRTLNLAYISRSLSMDDSWRFIACPGLQFWS